MLSFFPRGVLDEILNLIESVSEGFPSYSLRDVDLSFKMDLYLWYSFGSAPTFILVILAEIHKSR